MPLNHTHVTLPMCQQIFATQNFKPESNTKKIQIFERHKVHLPQMCYLRRFTFAHIYYIIYVTFYTENISVR